MMRDPQQLKVLALLNCCYKETSAVAAGAGAERLDEPSAVAVVAVVAVAAVAAVAAAEAAEAVVVAAEAVVVAAAAAAAEAEKIVALVAKALEAPLPHSRVCFVSRLDCTSF
jgi:hypothetical protein